MRGARIPGRTCNLLHYSTIQSHHHLLLLLHRRRRLSKRIKKFPPSPSSSILQTTVCAYVYLRTSCSTVDRYGRRLDGWMDLGASIVAVRRREVFRAAKDEFASSFSTMSSKEKKIRFHSCVRKVPWNCHTSRGGSHWNNQLLTLSSSSSPRLFFRTAA